MVVVQNSEPTAVIISYQTFTKMQEREDFPYFVSNSPSYSALGVDLEPDPNEYSLTDGEAA